MLQKKQKKIDYIPITDIDSLSILIALTRWAKKFGVFIAGSTGYPELHYQKLILEEQKKEKPDWKMIRSYYRTLANTLSIPYSHGIELSYEIGDNIALYEEKNG